MAHLRKHILSYVLIPLTVLFFASSYYRFIIINDHLISNQTDCDPSEHSCFIGCEDDECTETYYYAEIERPAVVIEQMCGPDITDCDAAYECTDTNCVIEYCDPTIFDCSEVTDIEL